MQQTPPIEWDPISINSTPPWESKFFVLYLLVVVTLSLVKFVSLGRQLWSFRRSSMPKSCGDGEQADSLAASALRGALPSQFADRAASERIAPQLMRKVEGEFVYQWEACSAKIQSMKRLVVLTFLLSVLAGAYRARTIFTQLSYAKAFGIAAFSGGMNEMLTLFALGILVCAILYVACGMYEGVLLRRRSSWNRSLAKTKNQSPDG